MELLKRMGHNHFRLRAHADVPVAGGDSHDRGMQTCSDADGATRWQPPMT
jgi:hypothetical protein